MRGAILIAAGMSVCLWGCGGHVPWQKDSASPSAAKYYNLGNAYFLADQLPEAILAFQRGLRLDPDDADVRANLDYARARVQYSFGQRGRPEEDAWPLWLYRPAPLQVLAVAMFCYAAG